MRGAAGTTRILTIREWVTPYNKGRPHLSLGPGIPEPAAVFVPWQGHDRHSFAQDCKVAARAVLGGLHHEAYLFSLALFLRTVFVSFVFAKGRTLVRGGT
jgi:hypothetical protein